MRSPTTAMTAEFCRRSGGIASIIVPAALALFIVCVFQNRSWGSSWGFFQFVTAASFLCGAIIVYYAQCDPAEASARCHLRLPRWLYTLPLPTGRLVAWQLLAAMLIGGAVYVALAGPLSLLFDLSWPIWLPAAALAVMTAVILAGTWLLVDSPLLQVIFALAVWFVGYVIGLWIFVFFWDQPLPEIAPRPTPQGLWSSFSTGGWLTLVSLVAASYVVSVWSVARDRRVEPALTILLGELALSVVRGVRSWLGWGTDASERRYASAESALFHSICRQMSVGRASLIPLGLWSVPVIVAYLSWRLGIPQELSGYAVVWGLFLAVIIQIGIVARGIVTGPRDPGAFGGTLPVNNVAWTRTVLKINATGVLLTVVALLPVSLLFVPQFFNSVGAAREVGHRVHTGTVPPLLNAVYGLSILALVQWTLQGLAWAIKDFARRRMRVMQIVGCLFIGYVVLMAAVLPQDVAYWFSRILIACLGLAAVAWTAVVYWEARRRELIGRWFFPAAVGVWLILSCYYVGGAFVWGRPFLPAVGFYLPEIVWWTGLLALPAAPFAAVPLALERFRHR